MFEYKKKAEERKFVDVNMEDIYGKTELGDLPPATLDNMDDVFDEKLSAETEAREALRYVEQFKFTNIDSLEELYNQINELPFIMGDEGEHLKPVDVAHLIYDGKYDQLPRYNNLRDIAQLLKDRHTDRRFAD